MTIYEFLYVHPDRLFSPKNHYSCKRITRQNIKQFGFASIEELITLYPNFPLLSANLRISIGKDPKGLRRKSVVDNYTKILNNKENDYNISPKFCPKCNIKIPFNKRNNKFCSFSCANSRGLRSEKVKDKIRQKIKIINQDVVKKIFNCLYCGEEIIGGRKTCNRYCYKQYRKSLSSPKNDLIKYRTQCAFKFNVYDYPEEFDLSLIEELGWYKATNRGDNPDGVSRDHIISVKYGFDNNIDPELLAHPANCQIIPQRLNISKFTKCYMSLEELKEKIKQWEEKYG